MGNEEVFFFNCHYYFSLEKKQKKTIISTNFWVRSHWSLLLNDTTACRSSGKKEKNNPEYEGHHSNYLKKKSLRWLLTILDVCEGGENHSSMVRHRPVNFICKKAVIFLYSIFTASDLKKGFYLLPIVNLLDSYKVYHKVDPPHLWKSLVKLASLVMFFATERSSWYSCAHTHLPCSPNAFIRLSYHHSPSLSICSGTTSSNVDFPPFFCFFPGNSYVFGILIFSVTCLRLFVRKHRPQILLRKS